MNLPLVLLLMIFLSPPDNQEETGFPEDGHGEAVQFNNYFLYETRTDLIAYDVHVNKCYEHSEYEICSCNELSQNHLESVNSASRTAKTFSKENEDDEDYRNYLYETEAVPISYDVHIHECDEQYEYQDCSCNVPSQNHIESITSTTRAINICSTESGDDYEDYKSYLYQTETVPISYDVHIHECYGHWEYQNCSCSGLNQNSLDSIKPVFRTLNIYSTENDGNYRNNLYETETVPITYDVHIHECDENSKYETCSCNDFSQNSIESVEWSSKNVNFSESGGDKYDKNYFFEIERVPIAHDVHIHECDERSNYETCSWYELSQNTSVTAESLSETVHIDFTKQRFASTTKTNYNSTIEKFPIFCNVPIHKCDKYCKNEACYKTKIIPNTHDVHIHKSNDYSKCETSSCKDLSQTLSMSVEYDSEEETSRKRISNVKTDTETIFVACDVSLESDEYCRHHACSCNEFSPNPLTAECSNESESKSKNDDSTHIGEDVSEDKIDFYEVGRVSVSYNVHIRICLECYKYICCCCNELNQSLLTTAKSASVTVHMDSRHQGEIFISEKSYIYTVEKLSATSNASFSEREGRSEHEACCCKEFRPCNLVITESDLRAVKAEPEVDVSSENETMDCELYRFDYEEHFDHKKNASLLLLFIINAAESGAPSKRISYFSSFYCPKCIKILKSKFVVKNLESKAYQIKDYKKKFYDVLEYFSLSNVSSVDSVESIDVNQSIPYCSIYSYQNCARIMEPILKSEYRAHILNQIMNNKKEHYVLAEKYSCPFINSVDCERKRKHCNCNLCYISYSCRNYPVQMVSIFMSFQEDPSDELNLDPDVFQCFVEIFAGLILFFNNRPMATLINFYFWQELYRRSPKVWRLS